MARSAGRDGARRAIIPAMQMTQRRSALADAVIPGQGLLRDAALVVGFALLVALFAQIAARLPFTPVPITGQTLAVLLTGGALGANRGAASLTLYALLGGFLPVFAPGSAALEGEVVHFILPGRARATGRGICPAAAISWVSSARVGRRTTGGARMGPQLASADRNARGQRVLYVPGLLWLRYDLSIDWATTLDWGLWPFVAGDLVKLYAASLALPAAWALVGRKGRG